MNPSTCETMNTEFPAIRHAMNGTDICSWDALLGELFPVLATPLSAEGEQLLLDILRFDGQLHLIINDELPHSLTPEDMLKSLAVQGLVKWTELTHRHVLERLEKTASPMLASLIRNALSHGH